VQRELAEVWPYFDAEEYAKSVLAGAPLRDGLIKVERREHVGMVRHLTKLTRLHVQEWSRPTDLSWIRGARCLESLNVSSGEPLRDLSALREHKGLKSLWLQGHGMAEGFEHLGELSNIDDIMFGLASDVKSIDFLGLVPGVRSLMLIAMQSIDDLEPIRMLSGLKRLSLSKSEADPVPVLLRCPTITQLTFMDGSLRAGLRSIESILPRLRIFGATGGRVGETALLARLTQVLSVDLQYSDVTDLRPMANLPELRSVTLHGCPPELDVSPLAALPQRVTIRLNRGQEVRGLDTVRDRHRIVRV
jgi:hypothetical protein